jgi:hypothetical protein
MSRKEEILCALAGVLIGCVFGYYMSLNLIKKSKEHQLLIQENHILQQELINCQENR